MTQIQVTKRDGRKEALDLDKLHRVVFWATEGITGVSASEVEIKSHLQFYNGIKTVDIQETLIKSAADLISEETPNYQYVAGRLVNYHLRKQVYGDYQPWFLLDLVRKNVDLGFYDPELMNAYSDDEWKRLNSFINHERDENFTYVAMEQWRGKYLVQNRVTGQIFETPQVAYLLIAATLFQSYPKETRLQWVKDYYDAISLHDISLPTPVMAGVRTPQKQFSSCVLIESDDSLDSINATTSSIVKYVSQKAGIGIGAGRIRALGSPIRNGDAYHTGVVPFLKLFQSATRSCCVTPDTWVEVSEESVRRVQIKDLSVGMKIKTLDEQGNVTFSTVTDKWNTVVPPSDQVRLEFENGTVLNCSVNHPIMVWDSETGKTIQKLPAYLTEADRVISEYGFTRMITADFGQSNDTGYIDITVDEHHTFFASASETDQMVLTHNSQGGVRNGAATLYYPIWHLEIEDLLVLKNNKGTEETRVRHMDYGVQFNKLMYERLITGGDITCFSPNDVPEMYEAFFNDQEKFKELYEKAERSTKLRKKVYKAIDLFSMFVQERKDTGRIYLQNADHANTHSPFDEKVAPVKMSNLCLTGDSLLEVRLSDGKTQKMTLESFVEQHQLGAMTEATVKSFDVNTNEVRWEKVSAAAQTSTVTELIEIEDETGHVIRCTPDHLIYTKNRGYVKAEELSTNDLLVCSTSNHSSIAKITTLLVDSTEVYDITVPETECFFANDILVHNCAEIDLPTVPMGTVKNKIIKVKKDSVAQFVSNLPSQYTKITKLN